MEPEEEPQRPAHVPVPSRYAGSSDGSDWKQPGRELTLFFSSCAGGALYVVCEYPVTLLHLDKYGFSSF